MEEDKGWNYKTPYKDPVDRTEKAELEGTEQIEEHLLEQGIRGYVLVPAKYHVVSSKAFIMGLAILDPHNENPEEIRFFLTPMEKLQFRPLKKDLIDIADEKVKINSVGDREWEFEINLNEYETLPDVVRGDLSYGDITRLNVKKD